MKTLCDSQYFFAITWQSLEPVGVNWCENAAVDVHIRSVADCKQMRSGFYQLSFPLLRNGLLQFDIMYTLNHSTSIFI